MPKNVSAVMDDSFNYSMWVEVYNSSSDIYDIEDFYFTDNPEEPTKWKPFSQQIAPFGYGILWFERDEITGHANFKLSPEGGSLYLMNNKKEIIDQITYPAQFRNVSYGRKTDGGNEWVFFSEYSPGKSNNNKRFAKESCEKPIFELPGGFYTGN
ncbi:MAG: hypothetical protein LUG18_07710 [Candidatus Azobacteroides sp.]|nr:hypothetical protein [Candidatus Azobacteroides sp.]